MTDDVILWPEHEPAGETAIVLRFERGAWTIGAVSNLIDQAENKRPSGTHTSHAAQTAAVAGFSDRRFR